VKVIACIDDLAVSEKILTHQTLHPIAMAMTRKMKARVTLGLMPRRSRESGTSEGDWLGSGCRMGQDFGVVAGRSSLRYRWMIH
jgi:hypothetical protein